MTAKTYDSSSLTGIFAARYGPSSHLEMLNRKRGGQKGFAELGEDSHWLDIQKKGGMTAWASFLAIFQRGILFYSLGSMAGLSGK